MATAGTISVLTHRPAPVFALVIIVGVAAGAIRPVRGRCPGGGLRIALVAVSAGRISPVVTGVLPRAMPEINGLPAIGVVAGITLQTGAKMIAGFARRLCAVMTSGTGTAYVVVIETGGYPCPCRVADIALCAGLYMVGRFAGRGTAVMATGAGAG